MLAVELVDDLDAARVLAPAWDALAVEQALPLCAPGWMLAWWQQLAPAGSELRIIALRDGEQLVALAPWFVGHGPSGRVDVRFLGAEISDRVDILCLPGREPEVRNGLLGAIAQMRPRPGSDRLRGGAGAFAVDQAARRPQPAADALPQLAAARTVGDAARGRAGGVAGGALEQLSQPGCGACAGGWRSVAAWCARSSTPPRLGLAVDALLRLHAARWEDRAPSHLTAPGVREMLHEAAAALGPDRLRLWTAEIDGELISVQLFQAAGGQIKYWNGGWMEQHADVKPTMLTILAALEDGIARGEHGLDLGAGTHPYKLRFADGDEPLSWAG